MLSLSIKEMAFFKLRYLLISFILFFVAALVFIISGLANGLSMDNASSIKTMEVSSFFIHKDSKNRIDRSQLNEEDVSSLISQNIQPLALQMASLTIDGTEDKVDVTFMAIEPGQFLEPVISKGNKLSSTGMNEVILDDSLQKEGIRIGSILFDERTKKEFIVIGFTKNQKYSHTPVAFMSLKSWKEFSEVQNGQYNALVTNEQNVKMEKQIQSVIDDGEWIEKDLIVGGIPGYEAEQSSLNMMLGFLIVIAVFVLAAFFYIMTIQKMNQFGILKAIGAKTIVLIKTTLFQVILLTLVSIGFAIGFTWIIFTALPEDIPFLFNIIQIGKYSIILFAVSLVGSLISSFNIIKADPIQAMGRVE